MNLLARREHSFHELLQKLGEKFPDFDRDEILIPALRRLQDDNLQSDARFTEAYVRYRSARGFGPLKIMAELLPRKVDRDLLRQCLYGGGLDWESLCLDAWQGKFRRKARAGTAERIRWQRFLQQRGFEPDQIRAVFRMLQAGSVDADPDGGD